MKQRGRPICLTIYLLYCFVDNNTLTEPIPSELGRLARLKYFYLGKSATMSNSELDTILQFISSMSL
jgi:hypothetical protein